MKKLEQILKRIPLFSCLSEDDVTALAEKAEIKEFKAGENIFAENSDSVTVVITGSVSVMKNGLLMRMLGEASVSGVASLYGEKRPVSALTANTASNCAFLDGEELRKMIRQNPALAEAYIRFLTSRVRFLNSRIEAYTSGSAEAKLSFHILYSDDNGSGRVDVGVSMSALADMLGMGRASLYRALDSLTGAGAIAREGSIITILDRGKLESFRENS